MLRCARKERKEAVAMVDYSPMVDLVTVPVTNYNKDLRKAYREATRRARRRNEQIAQGYARMNLLYFLEREQRKLQNCSKGRVSA
jgi:hypothetical protein